MSDKDLKKDSQEKEANEVVSESTNETSEKEVTENTDESTTQDEEVISVEKREANEVSEKEVLAEKEKTNTEEEEEEEVSSFDDVDEDEEDETIDYSSLTKEDLLSTFKNLLNTKPVKSIKNEVEEIKTEFNAKFTEALEEKKEEFLAEGGNIIDFHFSTPLKKEFNSLYFDYKEKRNNYYKNLKKDLQANLSKRLELIEELKGLLTAEENINTTYNHFKEIQTKWHEAGAIPRDKYNTVWNTYHHHVENFYDFLHLNREFRDLDFKHNLEQKLKLINRAEELSTEENIDKAFRELQMLHKVWKEELGPVAKEYREEVWEKFSAATKLIHDKRHAYQAELDKKFEENFDKKVEIVNEIAAVLENEKPNSHKGWQASMKKVQELRDKFFEIGKVPRTKNKEIWKFFKETTSAYNKQKNKFYKDQKKAQFDNLAKKKELIKIAQENKESDDFDVVTPLMKKIQADWKKIGHVPRRDSDKIWKEFKEACNFYFDRVHAQKNEANKEELANFEEKTKLLESLDNLKLSGDHKSDLATIKNQIKNWKALGRVPYNKKSIEQKFNKKLDSLFGQLDIAKKEVELIKYDNKLNSIAYQEDERKLRNEHFFIRKKIDETKAEINQLENNLGFFQHVDDDNPLVKEVHNNIQKHKEQLEVWKAKLKKIKAL